MNYPLTRRWSPVKIEDLGTKESKMYQPTQKQLDLFHITNKGLRIVNTSEWRTMLERASDKTLFQLSLTKWFILASARLYTPGKVGDGGAATCALCYLQKSGATTYPKSVCSDCPLFKVTGRPCSDSPYGAYCCLGSNVSASERRAAAKLELDYLWDAYKKTRFDIEGAHEVIMAQEDYERLCERSRKYRELKANLGLLLRDHSK